MVTLLQWWSSRDPEAVTKTVRILGGGTGGTKSECRRHGISYPSTQPKAERWGKWET